MLPTVAALTLAILAGGVSGAQSSINSTTGVSWQCENYIAAPTARYGGDCPIKDKTGAQALTSFQYAAIHSAYGANFNLDCQYGKTQCFYYGRLDDSGSIAPSPATSSCPNVVQRNASSVAHYPYPQAKFHCPSSAKYPNGTVIGSSYERLNGTAQHTLLYQCDYSPSTLQVGKTVASCVFNQNGSLKSGGKDCPAIACSGP